MAIRGLSQQKFEEIIAEYIRPSAPIDSFEHLFDRAPQLQKIEEAFNSPGRHVFIYGDRGAGKTSLAQTAAFRHHPSVGEPVLTACGRSTSFASIVRDVVMRLVGRSELNTVDCTISGDVSALGVKAAASLTEKQRSVDGLDLNGAASAIKEAAGKRAGKSVIVIDEFENLGSVEDRHLFAELIKQLSDRRANVSLIFCGIGKSLDDLLQGHNSAHRYIEEVKVPSPPLTFSGRWEIINSACKALNLDINDDSRLRIAQVSDGFPHYIHLICQKLFWAAFRANEEIDYLTPEHYVDAVREALGSVESRLRSAYDQATKKENDTYQEVLWAVADHFELERNNRRIYDESYQRVIHAVGREPLSFELFQKHLASLKSAGHGKILASDRRGWIKFSENLIRGYVRLVAESHGVRLALEHEPAPEPKQLTASARGQGVDPIFPRRRYGSWGR